jgi:hypothetical protein
MTRSNGSIDDPSTKYHIQRQLKTTSTLVVMHTHAHSRDGGERKKEDAKGQLTSYLENPGVLIDRP